MTTTWMRIAALCAATSALMACSAAETGSLEQEPDPQAEVDEAAVKSTCGAAPDTFCSGAACDKLNGKSGLCLLCASGSPHPSRGNMVVDASSGMTCNDLAMKMADDDDGFAAGSSECRYRQNKFSEVCCGTTKPVCSNGEGNPYPTNIPAGDHAWFNVCKNGQFPSKPQTQTIPDNNHPVVYTCAQAFWRGRLGSLPLADSKRTAYRNYVEQACGCTTTPTTTTPFTYPVPRACPNKDPLNNGNVSTKPLQKAAANMAGALSCTSRP